MAITFSLSDTTLDSPASTVTNLMEADSSIVLPIPSAVKLTVSATLLLTLKITSPSLSVSFVSSSIITSSLLAFNVIITSESGSPSTSRAVTIISPFAFPSAITLSPFDSTEDSSLLTETKRIVALSSIVSSGPSAVKVTLSSSELFTSKIASPSEFVLLFTSSISTEELLEDKLISLPIILSPSLSRATTVILPSALPSAITFSLFAETVDSPASMFDILY